MQDHEESRKLRERYRELAGRADRLAVKGQAGISRFVGQVYSGGAIPTTVPKIFLTHPATIFSPDTEGGTATTSVDTSQSIPVWVVGPGVPVANDYVIARGVNYRYAADFPASPCSFTLVTQSCRQNFFGQNIAIASVSYTVKSGATVIASGTTNGSGQATVSIPSAGTYTIETSTPGGQTDSLSASVTCGGTTRVNFADQGTASVFRCGSNASVGTTVTWTYLGNTIGTTTTNGSGVATATFTGVNPRGTVTVSVTLGGRTLTKTYTPSLAGNPASCGTVSSFIFTDTLAVYVRNCTPDPGIGPLVGATVSFFNVTTSTSLGTTTTNANGVGRVTPSPYPQQSESVRADVSATRWVSRSFNEGTDVSSFANCDGLDSSAALPAPARLVPAGGYACACYSYPLPTTLFLTDPQGVITLTYDPVFNLWAGCAMRTVVSHLTGTPCTGSSTSGSVPVWFTTDACNSVQIFIKLCFNGQWLFLPGTCADAVPSGEANAPITSAGATPPPGFAVTTGAVSSTNGMAFFMTGYVVGTTLALSE